MYRGDVDIVWTPLVSWESIKGLMGIGEGDILGTSLVSWDIMY